MRDVHAQFFRFFRDGSRQRVFRTFLRNRRPIKDFFLIHSVQTPYLNDFWPTMGQGSGLIHQEGLQSSHLFQISTALDQDPLPGCVPNGRHHGCWCAQNECAWTGNDEDGDRSNDLPCDKEGSKGNEDDGRNKVA